MMHSTAFFPCAIDRITIGERHRTDMGDLRELAASIEAEGLLQPIGITEDRVLVFGERRLRAVRDILGHDKIDVRIVYVSSIVAGEYAESIRKEFTPSERVAIAEALRSAIPERRGKDNPQNVAELKGEESRDIAADKAGFSNHETYRQAKAVVEHATPEIREQMDSGRLSISAAAQVAKQPEPEQKRIAALPEPEQKEEVRKLRTGVTVMPSSSRIEEQHRFVSLADAIKLLATSSLTPAQYRELHFDIGFRDAPKYIAPAINWLNELKGLLPNAETSQKRAI